MNNSEYRNQNTATKFLDLEKKISTKHVIIQKYQRKQGQKKERKSSHFKKYSTEPKISDNTAELVKKQTFEFDKEEFVKRIQDVNSAHIIDFGF